MSPRPLPPIEFLRECFSYDPETGVIRWRKRPISHFATEHAWHRHNDLFAGVEAGRRTDMGYIRIKLRHEGKDTLIPAHRIAFALKEGRTVFGDIDHVNGVKDDNRPENIREATHTLNSANRKRYGSPKWPKGVYPNKNRFRAYLSHNGKQVYLGLHKTPEAAHAAYCAKAKELYGEFFHPGTDIFG